MIEVNLDATEAAAIDFVEVLSKQFEHLKGVPGNVARSRVAKLEGGDYCRKWYGHPLVVLISIKSGDKPLPGDQAGVIAGKILNFGRHVSHHLRDVSAQGMCCRRACAPNCMGQQIADNITDRYGNICDGPPSHEP